MSVWLIRCKVVQCLPDECSRWDQCTFSPSISLCACLLLQTMTRLISRLPPTVSLTTNRATQTRSFRLLLRGRCIIYWEMDDMMSLQKAFILTRSITATLQLSFLLPSNWTMKQKPTATWASEEIASSVQWVKMCVFVQQPSLRGLKTDWRWASLMTYLANCAKGSKPCPVTFNEVPVWQYYTSDFF